jgi:acetylserotonin N-methyltransferase
VLHDWDEADVRRLLARSAEALPVGGRLIVHEAFLNQNKTGPLAMAEYSVLLMHVTKGRCYSTRELGGWLRQLGFRIEALVPTAAGRQALIART